MNKTKTQLTQKETFKKIQQDFIAFRRANGISANTTNIDRYYTDIFFNFLIEQNIYDIKNVSKESLHKFSTYLTTYKDSGILPETQGRIIGKVKLLFKYLIEIEFLLYDPSNTISIPKPGKRLPRNILNTKQIKKLLLAPDIKTIIGIRDRTILELLYSTAIRNSELVFLKINDLNLKDSELFILQGKGAKDRVVPIGKVAKEFILLYLKDSRPKLLKQIDNNYLFLTKTGKRFTPRLLQSTVKKYAKKVNLPGITPHSLRHTCATHLLKRRAPIRYIQKLLGHNSISSTQIYTHIAIEDLKEIHRKCHPREQ